MWLPKALESNLHFPGGAFANTVDSFSTRECDLSKLKQVVMDDFAFNDGSSLRPQKISQRQLESF